MLKYRVIDLFVSLLPSCWRSRVAARSNGESFRGFFLFFFIFSCFCLRSVMTAVKNNVGTVKWVFYLTCDKFRAAFDSFISDLQDQIRFRRRTSKSFRSVVPSRRLTFVRRIGSGRVGANANDHHPPATRRRPTSKQGRCANRHSPFSSC